jgi:hypothetical protein
MPEYVLDTSDAPAAWHALDSFAQGFIEAAFFSETACFHSSEFFGEEAQSDVAEGRADGNIPEDSSVGDIHPDEFAKIAAFCADFQSRAADLLKLAYERPNYDEAAAGRDLYFTYAGHGVGFWSRDTLENHSEEYERLTAIMVAAGKDSTAWNKACAARSALKADSLGERLSEVCGRGEVNLTVYESEESDSGFYVEFYISGAYRSQKVA